ncbi:MAG: hypothetical protein H7199_06315 [Burkholderiales bacterium]|nr:hypothetical protein [Flavobacterium sp.]
MHAFQLELLFQIIGIGSASGLLYHEPSLYLISDNGAYLYQFQTQTKALEKTLLFDNPVVENIPKKIKPDFESITHFEDDYFIFGSGSTPNRNKMFQYHSKNKTIKTIDLTNLYLLMQSFGNIKPEDFNIEGVVFTGEIWYFLQRGNAGTGKNGIFTVQGSNLENDFTILYNSYRLPKIKGIQSSFTDAVLINDTLYFLSTAENTKSTFDDGVVLGSFVGLLNTKTMKIDFTQQISSQHKFEGISLYQSTASTIEFLLCDDDDSDRLQTNIYKLVLNK